MSLAQTNVFIPSAQSGEPDTDQAMRAALVESLRHIHAAGIKPATGVDASAALSDILAHRVDPGVFGRYYDLVLAVQQRRYGDASTLFGELLDRAGREPGLTILPFTDAALGSDRERYGRLLDPTAKTPNLLVAPDPDDWAAFARNVPEALSLIEDADPRLAAEIKALVVLIVGASAPAQNATRTFDGASSFMLWGAVFLNVGRHRNPVDVVAGLVHEAAHQLLFAWSRNDPLVENAIDASFASPLRRDPRPMIGVYHATFVCARIHYAGERLLQSGSMRITDADRQRITALMDTQRRCFRGGHDTVRAHGRLTETGRSILAAAADYMARVV